MSMYQGMDLSRFKRVSSDKSSTTLRHSKGHEVRIAHSGLTPAMRDRIAQLPEHAEKVAMYAEGTPEKPVSKEDETVPVQPEPGLAEVPETTLATPAPQPVAAAPAPMAQPAAPQPVAPAMPEQPLAAPVQQQPAPQPLTPQQKAQQWTDQDLAFQRDLQMGHVKPQTVQDLFAKKDTLGKIGTIFGLMIGGAGAGLTKGPNVLLEMMNKEIDRDFEAQKATQSNAFNWRSLAYQHAVQEAQKGLLEAQAMNQYGQLQLLPSQIGMNQAQIKSMGADAALKGIQTEFERQKLGYIKGMGSGDPVIDDASAKADVTGKNLAQAAIVETLTKQANLMPDGPQKQAALQAVQMIKTASDAQIQQANLNLADKLDARTKLRDAAKGQETETAGDNSAIDLGKLQQLKTDVQKAATLGVAPKVSERDLIAAEEEGKQIENIRAIARMYDKTYRKLDQQLAGGKLNQTAYEGEVTALVDEMTKALTGTFGQGAAEKLTQSMFPTWKDFNGGRESKYEATMNHLREKESTAITAKRLGLTKPFPFSGHLREKKKPKFHEGLVIKDPQTGARKVLRNGKWEKLDKTTQAAK